jgi:hypothetical protein
MLKRLWQAWKELAHKIGNFQARVLLTIFYGILFPFGVATRWFNDSLRIKQRPTQWLDYPNEAYDMQWARRQ